MVSASFSRNFTREDHFRVGCTLVCTLGCHHHEFPSVCINTIVSVCRRCSSRRETSFPSPPRGWQPSFFSTSSTALMPSVPIPLLHSSLSCCSPLWRTIVLHWAFPVVTPYAQWSGGFLPSCSHPPSRERSDSSTSWKPSLS